MAISWTMRSPPRSRIRSPKAESRSPALRRGSADIRVNEDLPGLAAQLRVQLVHLPLKREVHVAAELLLQRLGFSLAPDPRLVLHDVKTRAARWILSHEIDLLRIEQ